MLNRPLHKFAIIGCGNISNTRHIPALKKCADRAEITALVSTSDAALTGTAAKVGPVHKMLVDPDKDLQRQFKGQPWLEEIDACVIGTPPWSHKSLAETMMLLGKDVLIEKPFAMSIDEADLLLEVEK